MRRHRDDDDNGDALELSQPRREQPAADGSPAHCQGCHGFACVAKVADEADVLAWSTVAPTWFKSHGLLRSGCPNPEHTDVKDGKCQGKTPTTEGKSNRCAAAVRDDLPWVRGQKTTPLGLYARAAWEIVGGEPLTTAEKKKHSVLMFWARLLPERDLSLLRTATPPHCRGLQLQALFVEALVSVQNNLPHYKSRTRTITKTTWKGKTPGYTLEQTPDDLTFEHEGSPHDESWLALTGEAMRDEQVDPVEVVAYDDERTQTVASTEELAALTGHMVAMRAHLEEMESQLSSLLSAARFDATAADPLDSRGTVAAPTARRRPLMRRSPGCVAGSDASCEASGLPVLQIVNALERGAPLAVILLHALL